MSKKPSHASMLVTMATNIVASTGEWFTGLDGTPYVTLPTPTRTLALKSPTFKQWLSREFYADAGVVPSSSSVSDAVNTLCGVAATKAQDEVFLRVAGLQEEVFLDLGRCAAHHHSGHQRRVGHCARRFSQVHSQGGYVALADAGPLE